MNEAVKARVFMSGRSQHVTIPAAFRFTTEEVYVQRDPASGALTLSQESPEEATKRSWTEIFKALDEAGASEFTIERDDSLPIERDFPW